MDSEHIVIIGAGHGGVQCAASLRDEGFSGRITLVNGEADLPYQRPPLSKAYMKGQLDAEGLWLRAPAFYEEKAITIAQSPALAIDRAARRVTLSDGSALAYSHLVLATGARPRPLAIPGIQMEGVAVLRTRADADALKAALPALTSVVVIGAGFIGLEFAAVAASLGIKAHVLELGARVMGRAVSPDISAAFETWHRSSGTELHFGASARALIGREDRVCEVELNDGRLIPADLVVIGIGILAEDRLAAEAGLTVTNGIVVDDQLVTSDPAISALGDCALYPSAQLHRQVRLESVQNAIDQGKCVAKRLTGKPVPYTALPWFWSDQGPLKLQIVGLSQDGDERVLRGDPEGLAFSVFLFREGRLACIESVNRPADHMAGRRLLAGANSLTPAQAGDAGFDLKQAFPA